MRGSDALALEIQGVLIASLAKVGSTTKVIIMDNQVSTALILVRSDLCSSSAVAISHLGGRC